MSTTNIVFAQLQQERRVYYLDCSYSMKSLKIWDKVRENLKTAIDNVGDETTELIVIPFTDRRVNHFPLPVFDEFATLEGKQKYSIDLYPDKEDYAAFSRLKEIKNNINDFVKNGKNILIYSKNTGNGKTEW